MQLWQYCLLVTAKLLYMLYTGCDNERADIKSRRL